MKLVKMKTLGIFGIGFLAGSKAGPEPWEKARQLVDQIRGMITGVTGGKTSGSGGPMSSNGFDSPRSQATPQMTEM